MTDTQTLDSRSLAHRVTETVRQYWHLGFTAFGGPGVHVVILRKKFVDKLKWLDSTTFADLFSLGNALPGPGSTQLAFSIAVIRNGTLPGIIAFFIWSLPASCGMSGLAAGIRNIPATLPDIVTALLTGLNAAAVGLIALAAYQLSSAAVTDKVTRLIVFLAASFGICYHAPWMYPVIMVVGGSMTLSWDFRRQIEDFALDKTGMRKAISKAKTRGKNRAEPNGEGSQFASSQETEEGLPMHTLNQQQEAEDPLQRSDSPDQAKKETSRPASIAVPPAAAQPSSSSSTAASLRQRTVAEPQRQDVTPTPTRAKDADTREQITTKLMTPSPVVAVLSFVMFVALLVTVLGVRGALQHQNKSIPRALDLLANMLIAGTIIFGGGPVVVPLLRQYVVDPGWVSDRDFLLGFAILQAFPGPNFAFASYLGLLSLPSNPVLGAVLGFIGIFSPGILLKLALLPLYNKWRKYQPAKSTLRGLNAAAAGLVYVAVWQLFLVGYIYTPPSAGPGQVAQSVSGPLTSDPFWAVIAAGAFVASASFGVYPAISIIGGGLAGLAWYGVVSN